MRRFFLLLVPTILTACAGNDVIVQRQGSMEGRLEQIMQAQNNGKNELAALAVQVKELRESLARQTAAAREAQDRYEALHSRVKILANRLEQVEAPRLPATIELVNRDNASAGRDEAVQAEYMKAFGLFSANNYAAATDAFTGFIASYPESEYAANARFWLAECYFSTHRYQEAIDTFSKVLDLKPSSGRAATALLRTGLAWKSLGEPAKSTTAFRTVVDTYPESEAAVQARQQLGSK